MWYIVYRKSKHSDVTIFHDAHKASLFAKPKKALTSKFKQKEAAIDAVERCGYTYRINDYTKPRKPAKKKEYPNYQAYLNSDAWKEIRNKRVKMDGYKCQVCGSSSNLEVHHLTYEHKYHENMDDLITLCDKCHRKVHGKSEEPPKN